MRGFLQDILLEFETVSGPSRGGMDVGMYSYPDLSVLEGKFLGYWTLDDTNTEMAESVDVYKRQYIFLSFGFISVLQ